MEGFIHTNQVADAWLREENHQFREKLRPLVIVFYTNNKQLIMHADGSDCGEKEHGMEKQPWAIRISYNNGR